MKSIILVFAVLLLQTDGILSEPGKLSFASYFGDHMVLQRAPQRAIVWGYAPAREDVVLLKISGIGNVQANITVGQDNSGHWTMKLPPIPGPGPYNVSLTSSAGTVSMSDWLFGDIWLCSGEGNMQFTIGMSFNATEELEQASLFPHVRVFTAKEETSELPQNDLLGIEEPWSIPSKETLGGSSFTYFSAVCWLYGKYLYQKLQVPIGLISSTYKDSPIEYWSSPDALSQCEHNKQQRLRSPSDSSLWNAMIHPFNKMTIFGAIWYQGESNVKNPENYGCRFPAMIKDWRRNFGQGSDGETKKDFPFGFVQLGPNRNDSSAINGSTDIRWHQTADTGSVPNYQMPNTFMAVAVDLPDFASPFSSLYPRDKLTVAHRLMLAGMSVAYKKNVGCFQGPQISAYYIDIGFFTLGIDFSNGTVPIQVFSQNGLEVCCSTNNQSKCDGTDSMWAAAPIIKHDDKAVTMSYKEQCANKWIMGLRYEWRESPCPYNLCAIYTKENGIPVTPFLVLGLIGGPYQRSGPGLKRIPAERLRII